jgi:hypothetical protein
MISFRQADLLEKLHPRYLIEIFPLTDRKRVYLGESADAFLYRPEDEETGTWGIQKDRVYGIWDRDNNLIVLTTHMHEEMNKKELVLIDKSDPTLFTPLGRTVSIKNGIIETSLQLTLKPENYTWYGHDGDRLFIAKA